MSARFNRKCHDTPLDTDELYAILAFAEFNNEVSDAIEPHEIPKSLSFNSGQRNDCDWNFYLGVHSDYVTYAHGDFYYGQLYRKRLKIKHARLLKRLDDSNM